MKQLLKIGSILLMLIVGTSCETEIPETDTTPPTFRLEISGDGFRRTFTEEDNFDDFQLNLKSNARYTILFSGADQGGLRRLQMEFPEDYIDFQSDITSPWQTSSNGFTQTIYWNGDQENPITGYIFNGSFVAKGNNVSPSFYVRAEDYGGENGPPFNITEGTLNLSIADQETNIVTF